MYANLSKILRFLGSLLMEHTISKQSFTLILFVFLSLNQCFTQNSEGYFRSYPSPDELNSAPLWAQLMYSSDPLIYEVVNAYNDYYSKNESIKSIHTQNYKHWIRVVEPMIDANGKIRKKSTEEEIEYFKTLKSKKSASNKSMDTWTSIGPFETYRNGTLNPVSWHANVYSIDQSENNSNLLICGTESGGVFKTTDKGVNWTLISKEEVFCNGITAVAIDPDDDDIFYISGNSRLYKSTDGGNTWTENYNLGSSIYEIKFDPSDADHIFLAAGNGLYESSDDAASWTQLFSEKTWDLDFHPTNSDIVYILKSNPSEPKTDFFRSFDNGSSWNQVVTGWYQPEDLAAASESGGKIAVSADSPDRVYACLVGNSKANDNGWIGLYRSDNSGSSWYLPSGQIGGPYSSIHTMPWNAAAYGSGYHQGFYNFDCEASPNDADLVWFGTIRLSESSDGGYSYISIGAANSQRLSDIHADIQSIHVSGNDVWVASDGGINYSSDDLQTHDSRKYGIIASNFWGFGTGWNDDVYVGGKYHNGNTAFYKTYNLGDSHNVGGVEEATGYVNPLNNRNAYFNRYWAGHTESKLLADALGGSTTTLSPVNLIPNEAYTTSYSSGIYHHPYYSDQMIAGKDSIIWRSLDGGTNWDTLHDFGQGRVLEIEYCRSNPSVIYAVFQPVGGYWDWCEVHKSVDGGETWSMLPNIPSNNRWRLEITTNPLDENEIWVASINGANGQKIYKSDNGGASWTNRTSSDFDGDKIRDIAYHGGSDELVYAITEQSFYYYDKPTDSWIQYDTGLPVVQNVLRIKLFYADNKIKLATKGRGIWEADFPATFNPQAMPMSVNDTIFCQKDTIQFESHSIVDHVNSSWNWTISPSPQYISNTQDRNPRIVFGTPGDYDITLEVTDQNSNTSSMTISDMVHVTNYCEIDTSQIKAIQLVNTGDYVQLPDVDVSTSTMTITAWIKPSQIQENYASVVMNDGNAAGLNFRESNNTLGYHWFNGGSWSWDSNLEVPVDEWSHVAMVVDPSGVSLYLNGIESRHTTAISAVDFTSLKIGSYKGWNSRNFYGDIDEVCIWTRALTTDEIRLYKHLTKEDVSTDPDFLAYYQFNTDMSTVIDKINSHHGTTNGSPLFPDCLAAFGGGISDIQNVSSGGVYVFSNTGIEMEFDGTGSLPNGDIVASRINQLPVPDPYNSEDLDSYFILNNYGNNSFTDNYGIKYDDPYSSPSTDAQNNPTQVQLYNRSGNAFTASWSNLCSMNAVSGEYYVFDPSPACSVGSLGQYFLNYCGINATETMDYIDGDEIDVRVTDWIKASNTIFNGANVFYSSDGYIELLPNFETKLGALFEAMNTGCSN